MHKDRTKQNIEIPSSISLGPYNSPIIYLRQSSSCFTRPKTVQQKACAACAEEQVTPFSPAQTAILIKQEHQSSQVYCQHCSGCPACCQTSSSGPSSQPLISPTFHLSSSNSSPVVSRHTVSSSPTLSLPLSSSAPESPPPSSATLRKPFNINISSPAASQQTNHNSPVTSTWSYSLMGLRSAPSCLMTSLHLRTDINSYYEFS
ncbi:hypothetical protein ABVT39_014957 [Epinephelus coioides]